VFVHSYSFALRSFVAQSFPGGSNLFDATAAPIESVSNILTDQQTVKN